MTETIACKHCGAAISAESIADGELAICNICDALDNLSTEPIALPEKVKAKRHSLALNKFHIKQHPDAVEITYRWWGKQHRNFFAIPCWMDYLFAHICGYRHRISNLLYAYVFSDSYYCRDKYRLLCFEWFSQPNTDSDSQKRLRNHT
ncbi:MAG: hypothetical protein Q9P01_03010 [Anaerolineae bacterium]|nr:hypothetical protein [Anaerolineae bacterium]